MVTILKYNKNSIMIRSLQIVLCYVEEKGDVVESVMARVHILWCESISGSSRSEKVCVSVCLSGEEGLCRWCPYLQRSCHLFHLQKKRDEEATKPKHLNVQFPLVREYQTGHSPRAARARTST